MKLSPALIAFSFLLISQTQAQESVLNDVNGDGAVMIAGFGDSITYGVGDPAFPAGGGYVIRTETLLQVPAENLGVPGEEIAVSGKLRFAQEIPTSDADVVVLMEGTNDAVHQTGTPQVRQSLQRAINVAHVLGKELVIMTLPAPCCDHAALAPFTTSYNASIRELALVNELRTVDLETVWTTTCQNAGECELYNTPEGLHPNGTGYDVIAQSVSASLLGIDILSPGGAAELESALGLPAGTVLVKPLGAGAQ